MTARWWVFLMERRRFKHSLPYSENEMALLRQVPAEGKALRRHRSRRRWLLLKGSAS